MSGSYPNNYNNNPMGLPRAHFSPQHQVGPNTANPSGNGGFAPGAGIPGQHPINPMHSAGRGVINSNQMPPQSLGVMPVRHMAQYQTHMPSEIPPNIRPNAHAQQPQSSSYQQGVNTQPPPGTMMAISHQTSSKEINIVALSRLGQETVQDITSRFQEIFGALKIIQPTANRDNSTEKKVQEYFRTIRLLFKRLRIIYEKCNDGYPQDMEYAQVVNLISYKDEAERRTDNLHCEDYRKALQENQELIETVKLKNRQLREIIDRHRIIIWEINTMLSMRRS